MNTIGALASLPKAEPPAKPAAEDRDLWDRIWGKEGFSFGALLDIINPLQHIPVVSTIYRAATGDTIGPGPRIAGGALFGGVIGLIASATDAAVEAITGKDTGSHVMAMLPEPDSPAESQWASNERRGQRPQMAGLLNQPETDGHFAVAEDSDFEAGVTAEAASAAPEADATPISSAAAKGSPDTQHPTASLTAAPGANPIFAAPARTAQAGAGGKFVPLAASSRAPGAMPIYLPPAQTVAADPALLRELRHSGAAAASAGEKPTGRIDTAIKGHGLVTPNIPATGAPGTVNWLDYAVRDPRAKAFDAETKTRAGRETDAASPRDASAIPEVGPDFLMKMRQALDKYQALRNSTPPSVDLSH